ncbi:MAG: hypothetical protein NWE96_08280 [Candidatus Bathyarchaeota archaeon]|nr:hypothetical protein [Candidatus Bathyarchaeota archaeon]
MKKEIALIAGAVFVVLLFYPLTWFTNMNFSWAMILMLPLMAIILYSMYHAVKLVMNKNRRKAVIFVGLLVGAVFVTFQFVLFMIRLTMPVMA